MKSILLLLPALLLFTPVRAASADKELARLESALQAASSQTDMNVRSGDIAQYLDHKLTTLETRIKKNLDNDGLELFAAASKLWREYRLSQTKFEGDIYRGGSIQPLIHNSVFARITQERLSALQNLDPEGKYKDN